MLLNIRGGRRLLGTLFGEGFACTKYTDKGVSLPRPLLEKKVVHNLVQAESQVIKLSCACWPQLNVYTLRSLGNRCLGSSVMPTSAA